MQKESLMFIVRDWNSIESDDESDDEGDQNFSYGMEGRKDYFNTLIRKDSPNKAKEHKSMREY